MPDLRENAITLLARTVVADVQADSPTRNVVYTVPPGKRMIVDQLVIHTPTASLAGMDDVDFGGGAAAITPAWLTTVTAIAEMTDVEDYYILRGDANEYIMIDGDDSVVADRDFVAYVVSGSTGAAGATFDLFGYLIDS